jgi:hypothetical protein
MLTKIDGLSIDCITKETPWRRATDTSSLNEMSTFQLGNRAEAEGHIEMSSILADP